MRRFSLVTLLMLSIAAQVSVAQNTPGTSDTEQKPLDTHGKILSGQIRYDENADPIPPLLLPGNPFDKDAARELLRDKSIAPDTWRKIPSWLAGSWEQKDVNYTKVVNYVDGKSEIDSRYKGARKVVGQQAEGRLRDKNGDIWDESFVDYWTKDDMGNRGICYRYYVSRIPRSGSNHSTFYEVVNLYVDPSTSKITRASRSRGWKEFLKVSPGTIKEKDVSTRFDERGIANQTFWSEDKEHRKATFESVEGRFADQKALEERFRAFCKQKGLGDLLPIQAEHPNNVPLLKE